MRRILFLFALAGAFMFYVFHTSYFSWILMLVSFILLPLSLCISIPIWIKSQLRMECSTLAAPVSDGFSVALRCDSIFPMCPVSLRLRFENTLTGTREDYRLSLASGETVAVHWTHHRDCGIIRCSVLHSRIFDLVGFFSFPIKKPNISEVLLYPDEIPFTDEVQLFSSPDFINADTALRPSPSGEKEPLDVRDYREGDLLRDVHWKLSARSDHLIIREFERLAFSNIRIALLYSPNQDELRLSLGRLFGLCNALFRQKISPVVFWNNEAPLMENNPVPKQELANLNDLFLLFRKLLSEQLPENPQSSLHQLQTSGNLHDEALFLVSANAISLWDSGEIKEQYT